MKDVCQNNENLIKCARHFLKGAQNNLAFQIVECTFRHVECMFHVLECMFQHVEYKRYAGSADMNACGCTEVAGCAVLLRGSGSVMRPHLIAFCQ